jgi:hypothetical protein
LEGSLTRSQSVVGGIWRRARRGRQWRGKLMSSHPHACCAHPCRTLAHTVRCAVWRDRVWVRSEVCTHSRGVFCGTTANVGRRRDGHGQTYHSRCASKRGPSASHPTDLTRVAVFRERAAGYTSRSGMGAVFVRLLQNEGAAHSVKRKPHLRDRCRWTFVSGWVCRRQTFVFGPT